MQLYHEVADQEHVWPTFWAPFISSSSYFSSLVYWFGIEMTLDPLVHLASILTVPNKLTKKRNEKVDHAPAVK